jgi:ribose transport system substrate-binding protein
MKTLLLLMLIVVLSLSIAACSGGSGDAETSDDSAAQTEEPAADESAADETAADTAAASASYKFAYLSPNHGNPFWQMVASGVETQAQANGCDVTVFDAQDDPAKQVSQAEDALQGDIDALFLSPFETDTGTTIAEMCNAAGVPIFILDTGAEADYTCFITSDNKQGGRVAAEYLIENTDDSRVVAEEQGLIGRAIPALRGVGFNEVMDENNIKVEFVQPADYNREKGMTLMENFLTSNPKINAVFCWNDEMALGAKEAIAARDLTGQVLLIGFDATDEAVQSVLDGEMSATVAQNPKGFGTQGVDLALKHLAGEEIEKEVLIECKLVTKDNAQASLDGTLFE